MTRAGRFGSCVFYILAGILLSVVPVVAVEHPGSIGQDANCVACHGNKVSGKSVHSAMQSPCGVCHVTMTQGDMTTVSLSMPKGKIDRKSVV